MPSWAALDDDDNSLLKPMAPVWYTVFGWIYILTTLPTLLLHVAVGLAIYRIPTLRQRITLRLMLWMGVADGIQILLHAITGFVVVLDAPLPDGLNYALGVVIETAWEWMMFMQLFLASNRLYIVTRTRVSREDDFKWFDTPVVVSLLAAFVYTWNYWQGGRFLHFEIGFMGWTGIDTTDSPLVSLLANGEVITMSVGGFMCILTGISITYRRLHQSLDKRKLRSMEVRLFAQTCIVYVLSISNIILWNIDWKGAVEVQALLNLEWILICGVPPYLNLMMSGEIRRSLLQIVQGNKVSKVHHTQAFTVVTRARRLSVVAVARTTTTLSVPLPNGRSNRRVSYQFYVVELDARGKLGIDSSTITTNPFQIPSLH